MSGGKETPRQKMIGMMYLVLTALLALNVSKEILNAFVIVENGLNTTNTNFDGKNGILYSKFENAMKDNKAKTEPFYKKAMEVKAKSQELCKMVDDIRAELYMQVQKLPTKEVADTFKLVNLDSKDNYDIPTHYMLGDNPEEPSPETPSIKLKEAIEKFKVDILKTPQALRPEQAANYEKESKNIKLGLNTGDVYSQADEKVVHWEFNNFDHTTMAADMCIFAGIKNDIKNAESDVVGLLLKSISSEDFSFDAVEAKVVANANYITAGEEYTADIFVSAHSSTQDPQILIGAVDTSDAKHPKLKGEGTIVPVTSGVGKYVVHTGAEGDQEYSGVINVKAPDGSIKPYPFSAKYTVAKPAMAVSPTKMNVFYIGVPNPVDISVAGTAPKDVNATFSGGNGTIVNKGEGHYEVNVKSGDAKGMIMVNVTKKDKKGQKSAGPPVPFRVKRIPDPAASFCNVIGDGSADKNALLATGGCFAKLDNFAFDLQFPVTSWVLSMNLNGLWLEEKSNGPALTPAMRSMLEKAKKGSKVLIEQVHCKAPDGDRKIAGCNIKVR